MTKRSLWRWLLWRLTGRTDAVDWSEVCLEAIEEDDTFELMNVDDIYFEVAKDDIYHIVDICGMNGACAMYVEKKPDDKKMRGFDWVLWLGTALITTHSFDVPEGLQKLSDQVDPETSTKSMILFTGGTPGQKYRIIGWIEADDGRKDHGIIEVFISPT